MKQSIFDTLLGTGFLVIVIGWFVDHFLTSKRDGIARKDNASMQHLEKQIQELYGPLFGLIRHSQMVFDVSTELLPKTSKGEIEESVFSETNLRAWRFFIEYYFLPINAKIRDLINGKMHLLESGELPKSFELFLAHEAQFELLHNLWKVTNIDSSKIEGKGWPIKFEADVKNTLSTLRLRQQNFLQKLISQSAIVG